jgi:transcriptional antiterminator RfaH
MMTDCHRWFVVHTQPLNEKRAELNLRQQGFSTYLTRYQRTRRHARRSDAVARPLFPRYLFFSMDIQFDRWHSIRSTNGVDGLIMNGDRPAPVPEGVVEDIRARENGEGFVALGLPAGVGPGSRIWLVDSVFAGSKGVIERIADESRVSILFEMLGRQIRVLVPAASVGVT